MSSNNQGKDLRALSSTTIFKVGDIVETHEGKMRVVEVTPDGSMGRLVEEKCDCGRNQVCHLCPDSKRRRIVQRIDGTDPHRYTAPAPPHAKGGLTRRERLHQETQVRAHFDKKLGRRMSNKEWAEMKQLIANRTREQLDARATNKS